MPPVIDPKVAPRVQSLFPNEELDFAIHSKRKIPLFFGIFRLIAALFVLTITFGLSGPILGSIFNPPSDSENNRYILMAVFGIFFILGIIGLIDALRIIFWDPVVYVGTDQRIAMIGKKDIQSKKWHTYFDNVLKTGKKEKGNIILTPKPGITGESAFIMRSIPNPDAILAACKKRIMEASKTDLPPNTITLEDAIQ